MSSAAVARSFIDQCAAGCYSAVFAAPPCKSYSVAHRPKLRTSDHPLGLPMVPPEWTAYVQRHNAITQHTADVLRAAMAHGALVMLENPADRAKPGCAQWRKHADHGSIWRVPAVRELGLVEADMAQCMFGAPVQKWTSIGVGPGMNGIVTALEARRCTHVDGGGRHPEVAHGRDAAGSSRAERAAAYPAAMNAFLAAAFTVALARQEHAVRSTLGQERQKPQHSDERASTQPGPPTSGRVAAGIALSPEVVDLLDAARQRAPGFASMRSMIAAPRAELRAAPLPGELHRAMQPRPHKLVQLKRGRPLPPAVRAEATPSSTPAPDGPIHISQLFLPGVYEQVIAWLASAAAAARELRAGRKPRAPDTLVVEQQQMQEWARGIAWDTSDPDHCVPVASSDANSAFPGSKQIDRAALRSIAAEMEWTDTDIVDQVGHGGVEPRSECPLTTVLAWHHNGLVEGPSPQPSASSPPTSLKSGSRPPVPHLPYVPCRALPRNVLFQTRTRKLASGELEEYEKPRISTDASDGAELSVNGGVPQRETGTELPTVQQFARGLAIVDTAADSADGPPAGAPRAVGYAVDATSAFRFLPLQWRWLWTSCFLWWEVGGDGELLVGFSVDRRMGFGGRYAPNRFERISRLVGAYIQRMQRTFDTQQPPPSCVDAWVAQRAEAQQAGHLPPGHAQLSPAYLQVYMIGTGRRSMTPPRRPRSSSTFA